MNTEQISALALKSISLENFIEELYLKIETLECQRELLDEAILQEIFNPAN